MLPMQILLFVQSCHASPSPLCPVVAKRLGALCFRPALDCAMPLLLLWNQRGRRCWRIASPQSSWPLPLSKIHLLDKLVQGQLGSSMAVLPPRSVLVVGSSLRKYSPQSSLGTAQMSQQPLLGTSTAAEKCGQPAPLEKTPSCRTGGQGSKKEQIAAQILWIFVFGQIWGILLTSFSFIVCF